ncbi:MAG: hypothetical protein LRY51_18635 [Geovibrio sp.]|nr:hypothetical protein [Geovibrio sp.]
MKVKFTQSLPYKQAKMTFFIAFTLGLLLSIVLLWFDFRREQEGVENRLQKITSMMSQTAGHALVTEKQKPCPEHNRRTHRSRDSEKSPSY